MVIRHEYFGNLIWSDTNKCYFICADRDTDKQLEKFLQGEKQSVDFLEELKELGFNQNLREIISDNDNLSAPLDYYFDFTDACNLKCTHCYNREILNNNTMTEEQIVHVIKDMYDNGVMRLHLAGGEPTMFKDKLRKYMETAKKYGIVTSMSTNGTLIDDEIGDILKDNDVISITISIESADEKKNAKIRGKEVLSKSIEGIKKISEYRKNKKAHFNISIKMSYDINNTEEDFEDMISLARKLNVDTLKLINPERCIYHERHYYSDTAKKYYQIQGIIRKLQELYKDSLNITIVNSPVNLYCTTGLPNMKGCIGAQELIAINPNGQVTPCLMNKYDLGNIFEDISIKDIYKSDKIKNYKKLISDYHCEDCKYSPQCRGGCQIRKIVEYGKITSIDPLCPIKNEMKTKKIECEQQKYKYFKKINVYHSL